MDENTCKFLIRDGIISEYHNLILLKFSTDVDKIISILEESIYQSIKQAGYIKENPNE